MYTTFVKMFFFNSKMGVLTQRPMNRNYKGRAFKKHHKYIAFGNSVFAASDFVVCVAIVFLEKA